jgi:hypothetical protein
LEAGGGSERWIEGSERWLVLGMSAVEIGSGGWKTCWSPRS